MKYFNWLELTRLKLTKQIELDGMDLKFPISLNKDCIEEVDYKPEELSKKVFSFCLYFNYYADGSYVLTYILGLLYNYRLLLLNKSMNHKDDYKFRVYIDKKSFYENKSLYFYLSYLKKLEIEILSNKTIDYEWLELILCDIKELNYNKSLLMCFRFLPFFEGCEFHSRDLDFRLSKYDYELIAKYNSEIYSLYFCSSVLEKHIVNPFLGGCWGGNINNLFSIRKKSMFNKDNLKFFTSKSFIALCLMYNNLFDITFGIDELMMRFYVDLLSDTYIDNCMVFGKQLVNSMMDYMSKQYICTNKIHNFQGINVIYGYNFISPINELIGEPPRCFQIVSFKFDELSEIYKINLKSDESIYNFVKQPINITNFFNGNTNLTSLLSIIKNMANDIHTYLNGETSRYLTKTQIEEIINMENIELVFEISKERKSCDINRSVYEHKVFTKINGKFVSYENALNYVVTETELENLSKFDDYFIPLNNIPLINKIFEKISFDFERLLLVDNELFEEDSDNEINKLFSYRYDKSCDLFNNNRLTYNTTMVETNSRVVEKFSNINKIIIPSYAKSTFNKHETTFKFNYEEHIGFDVIKSMKLLIDEKVKDDDVNIISIPSNSKIKLIDGSLIFDINQISNSKELECKKFIRKDINHIKIIYFTSSKIVFSFILNSVKFVEYMDNKNNICGFGKTYLGDMEKHDHECGFYTLNKLVFYNSKDEIFYPFETTGGNVDYYDKYIKYKNKYLLLKNKCNTK
jgi:hypothetical protein